MKKQKYTIKTTNEIHFSGLLNESHPMQGFSNDNPTCLCLGYFRLD